MREHRDPILEAEAAELLADPRVAPGAVTYSLTIAGEPVRPREVRAKAEDIRTQDVPAMILEGTLPGSKFSARRYEGAEAVLTAYVGRADYVEFRGDVTLNRRNEEGDTTLEGFSAGRWLSRQEFGREVAWGDTSPRAAMWDAVRGAGIYRAVDLSGVSDAAPRLYTEPEEVFEKTAKRAEHLDEIRRQSRYAFFDDPDGVGRGLSLNSLAVPGPPAATYRIGESLRPHAFKPSPAFDARYSHVLVYRDALAGGREDIETFPIDNRGVFVPENVPYEIQASDRTARAHADAMEQGIVASRALSYGAWEAELTPIVYDPRILRGTTLDVLDRWEEGDEIVTGRYLMVVAGYNRNPKSKEASYTGAALQVGEERRAA